MKLTIFMKTEYKRQKLVCVTKSFSWNHLKLSIIISIVQFRTIVQMKFSMLLLFAIHEMYAIYWPSNCMYKNFENRDLEITRNMLDISENMTMMSEYFDRLLQ